jgi:hypothetical protein
MGGSTWSASEREDEAPDMATACAGRRARSHSMMRGAEALKEEPGCSGKVKMRGSRTVDEERRG